MYQKKIPSVLIEVITKSGNKDAIFHRLEGLKRTSDTYFVQDTNESPN